MSRRGALLLGLGLVCCAPTLAAPARSEEEVEPFPADSPFPAPEEEPDEEEEEEGLRERLTEREDQRRPAEPWSLEVAGRPLTVSGEYEIAVGGLRRRVVGEPVRERDRVLLEQELELEVFYSFGPPLSLFVQVRAGMEEDLLPHTFESVSDLFVERGETWLYSEDIAGTGLNFDVGRLDFEDDRRWWWDEEIDALRLAHETDATEVVVAVAYELFPSRSDRDRVDPELERVLRVLAEASWDVGENHALELFALFQDDHSRRQRVGEVLSFEREDDSDARLTWVGGRAMGVFDLHARGLLGYWLDGAAVTGSERLFEFEPVSSQKVEVVESARREVFGWAVDAGVSWILPLELDPRVFAGYAFGSGDPDPDAGDDRSFRQTELHANEAGFGGVERFASYGIALDPELANLGVLTVGAGLSLLRSSSLDLVYHHYRLAHPADSLRDSRMEVELDGRHRDLGHGIDLVLALEEWKHLELELAGTAFRAGRAFGSERGTWTWGGAFAVRYAF